MEECSRPGQPYESLILEPKNNPKNKKPIKKLKKQKTFKKTQKIWKESQVRYGARVACPIRFPVPGFCVSVPQELQELYSTLEEAKADIVGLWALHYLLDKVKGAGGGRGDMED